MSHPEAKHRGLLLAVLFAALLAGAGAATADDRDLLRDSEANPYAFFVVDTSISMHVTSPCTEMDAAQDIDPWDGMCTRECPLEAAVCQQFDPTGGCVEYSVAYDDETPAPLLATEIDDGAAALSGAWIPVADADSVGGGHQRSGGATTLSATFTPTITEAGQYHVYLSFVADPGNASNVPVTINHDGGATKVRVDQTRNSQDDPAITTGRYNYVGTFSMSPGTGSVVIGTANTSGEVVADAVRFAWVSDPGGVTCTQTGRRFQQPLCPRGDCYAPANADDPSSKMFQIKEALYEVFNETGNVHFGLGSYEQDQARAQAKHWLYRVPETKPDTTPQDFFTAQLPSAGDFPVPGSLWVFGLGAPYDPATGAGDGWNCVTADPGADPEGDSGSIACKAASPADADNLWEMERARRLPKLGLDGSTDTEFWYREPTDTTNPNFPDGQVYRATLSSTVTYGDATIQADIELFKCDDAACSAALSIDSNTLYFELVTDFLAADSRLSRMPMRQSGFFDTQETVQLVRHNDEWRNRSCFGLEPNEDTSGTTLAVDADLFQTYTHKWATEADPRSDPAAALQLFDVGDFVPFDWLTSHQELVKGRMAPNLYDPTSGDFDASRGAPDFRTATFWNDDHLAGDNPSASLRKLRLKEAKQSNLIAFGETPLANSLDDFGYWFGLWSAEAEIEDPRWECRNSYVILLTDGNDTCQRFDHTPELHRQGIGSSPPSTDICGAAADLLAAGVKTYVVGFGLGDDCNDGIDNDRNGAIDAADVGCQPDPGDPDKILAESSLACLARDGGTEEPILPRNKDELVEALRDIFSQIIPTPKAFTSASIPAQQSSAADQIFLSSFVPLPGAAVWPGRIDGFRKPLPLDADNRPDTSRGCGPGLQSGCHLWEVGERLLDQAMIDDATLDATAVEADVTVWSAELQIGDSETTRRVFYPQENLTAVRPNQLTLFRPPKTVFDDGMSTPDTADLEDLARVLAPDSLAQFIATSITDKQLQEAVNEVIKQTLRPKDAGEAADVLGRSTYLLGDIFHSDPVVTTSPANFVYFANDVCGRIQPEGRPNNCVAGEDRGYRQFTQEHVWRRRMLVAATNDGQLHFFDAGILVEGEERLPDGQLREFKVFSDGTGGELFSYMPRLTMPVVREQATGNNHIYALDGTLAVREVFVDPITDNLGNIDPDDRQWRTVLFGGLREAGDTLDSGATIGDLYSGYYALDITQPDQLTGNVTDGWLPTPRFTRPTPDDVVNINEMKLPSCLDFDYGGDGHQEDPLSCPQRFPMELWTFTDAVDNQAIGPPFLDEDANGVRDLGDTWSTPVIGQIALCTPGGSACNPDDPADDDDLITQHVMIFGGGIDPANKAAPTRGDWLYMVDVETGEAIYKRQLEGAAVAPPTVLDLDRDGIFDVIYQATTGGFVYKVDLDGRDAGGDLPDLAFKDVLDTNGTTHSGTFLRIDDAGGWDPYKILKTEDGVPIYFAPVAFFIPETGHYGLAVGTGEREDLWQATTQEGRFYVIVDNDIPPPVADPDPRRLLACEDRVPIEDACLEIIPWDQDPAVVTMGLDDLEQRNVLLNDSPTDNKQGGWVMTFPDEFRMTSPPFVVSSILVFSTFQPEIFITGPGPGATPTCAQTGDTLSFVVQIQNANPVARLSAADQGTGGGTSPTTGALKSEDRYLVTPEFTTAPFIDRTSSKNQPPGGGSTILDLIDQDVENGVRQAIMSTFPRGARFNDAYQIAIAALRNSTGLTVYATIPVAIYPADWRDP